MHTQAEWVIIVGMNCARIYIGTYTDGASRGIYQSELDRDGGRLSEPRLVAQTPNPTYLALHPSGGFLYAANELYGGKDAVEGGPASVSAFAVDGAGGELSPLNRQPAGGAGACYVTVDHSGRCLLVANYGSGTFAILPIGADGRLSAPSATHGHQGHGQREEQKRPHGHCFVVSPDNQFAFAVDLGVNRVDVHRLDAAAGKTSEVGQLTAPPGAGPRHLRFHPSGRFAYVINELDATVSACTYAADAGRLEITQTVSMLPPDWTGKRWAAELAVHPDGRWVYASNRGHDSLARFEVDASTGRLTPRGHTPTQGQVPRHFAIDPSGMYVVVAHQESGNVVVFRLDPASGELSPTGAEIHVEKAVCVIFA